MWCGVPRLTKDSVRKVVIPDEVDQVHSAELRIEMGQDVVVDRAGVACWPIFYAGVEGMQDADRVVCAASAPSS
jgi:hypothetical protein